MNYVDTGKERDTSNKDAGKDTHDFRVTWARTPDRAHIGKIQTSSGKWPPTRGAKSTEYLFKAETYAGGLEAYFEDFKKRVPPGHFSLIAGGPLPGLKGKQARRQVNLVDVASTRFTIDFDGLTPADVKTPIDSMGAYAEEVILVALDRLPEAFRQAKCMIAATSSTGLRTVSTGLPSEGKARFRATWELTRPLTCEQKKRLAKAIDALPGFGCIDETFYSPEHFEFVARPLFLKGETDPIPAAMSAYMISGDLLDVEALCAQLELDLDKPENPRSRRFRNGEAPHETQEPPGKAPGASQEPPREFRQDLVLDLPPEQAEPLLRALMAAIGNEDDLRPEYNEWFGIIAAIFNASKGAAWGLDIAVEWTASGEYPTQEVNDKWKTLTRDGNAGNGIDNLIRLAVARANEAKAGAKAKTEAGKTVEADVLAAKAAKLETAVSGINRAIMAAATFPDDLSAEEKAEAEAVRKAASVHGGIWAEFGAALARLRAARPTPVFADAGWTPDPDDDNLLDFDFADTGPVPLRPDMTDRHTRGEVSMLVGSGGGGKSTMFTNYMVAVTCENPAAIGQASIDWCGDVIIVTNEENHQTVRRRIRALRNKLGLSPKDQKHHIVIWRNRLVLGHAVGADGVEPTRAAVEFVESLAHYRAKHDIALVLLDTAVSLFSGINENGVQMDKAVGMIAEISEAGFLASDFAHHTSKAQDGKETATSFRGSTTIGNKVREHSTIVPVPSSDWSLYGWTAAEGAHSVRIAGQKANDKPIAGAWCFRWEFPSLPAYDARTPNDLKFASIGILAPLGPAIMSQNLLQRALRALYDAHQKNPPVTRGSTKGPVAAHHAHFILEGAGLGDRKGVEALIVELLRQKLLTQQGGWVGKNAVVVLVPHEPDEQV